MIKFLSEDTLLEIKNNVSILYHDVLIKRKSLEEVFRNDKLILDTAIAADDFQLDMSADKPELTDLENVKRVYKNMRSLSESQASDERIWAAYTLSVFKDYMFYRWAPDSEKKMMNRYFFSYTPKRSLFRNGIARLWWIGHLTYYAEGSADDRYKYTNYVCKKQDNINLLLDINFGSNHDLVIGVIQALIDIEKSGLNVDRDIVRQVSEYVNTLGGTYLIDAFSRKEIYEKCIEKLEKLAVHQ